MLDCNIICRLGENPQIHSQLLRCSTTRGSNTGLFVVSPTRIIKKFEDEKIICQIARISYNYDKNGDRMSKNDKSCQICIIRAESVILKGGKYGLSLYI